MLGSARTTASRERIWQRVLVFRLKPACVECTWAQPSVCHCRSTRASKHLANIRISSIGRASRARRRSVDFGVTAVCVWLHDAGVMPDSRMTLKKLWRMSSPVFEPQSMTKAYVCSPSGPPERSLEYLPKNCLMLDLDMQSAHGCGEVISRVGWGGGCRVLSGENSREKVSYASRIADVVSGFDDSRGFLSALFERLKIRRASLVWVLFCNRWRVLSWVLLIRLAS